MNARGAMALIDILRTSGTLPAAC
eukprot:SAG25_NODE_11425_length_304_cov_2.790244_2_plen_23_part_01